MTFDEFWHQKLNRPYILSKRVDVGRGTPIVLLHGIGRSATVWKPLVAKLNGDPYRVLAYDLLGSGDSPKPQWPSYDIDVHANAVIATIKKQHFGQPVIVIGHSLGSLVALRVARLRPDLVRHVVLYEMPLYEGLPDKRRYKARLAVYFAFYDWATRQNPSFGETKQRFSEKLATKIAGAELTRQSWQPFIKTIKNSIMLQTAADDLQQLTMAADVIYGSRDMFVIRGKVQTIYGKDAPNVTPHTIKERHRITPQAAAFIYERIRAVEKPLQPTR